MRQMVLNKYSKIIIGMFLVMVLCWVFITVNSLKDTIYNFLYGAMLGLLPLIASFIGFINVKQWGWFKSSMGKAVFFISAGLLTWAIGTLIFAYYNIFLQIAVPYPSLADVAYILSWPLWGLGILFLSGAVGVKYGLKEWGGKVILFLVPLLVIIASYYLLVIIARGGSFDFSQSTGLKMFFDLFYPIGDVVILTSAVLVYSLSYNYLGGKFKIATYLILLGFILNYLADFSFSYTTTVETFYTGSWVDLLFTAAMFLLSVGLISLDPKRVSEAPPSDEFKDLVGNSTTNILTQIILAIIKRQEKVAGAIAWEEAKSVEGLRIVDQKEGKFIVTGDFKEVINKLVGRYRALFGDLAVQVSKDAAQHFVATLPAGEVPEILK